jgi:hypothetical protein
MKNNEREDEEVDGDRQEIAVGEKRNASFGEGFVGHRPVVARRRRPERDEPVAEVQSANEAADDRHDQILDQRIDQLSERGADDHADCKIDHAALERKLAKLFHERHGIRSCG